MDSFEEQLYVQVDPPRETASKDAEALPYTKELVVTKKYGSADEFLRDISYSGGLYSQMSGQYVYRGHQSGTYKLIPSVLRHRLKATHLDGSEYVEKDGDPIRLLDSELVQREMEYFNLRTFFEICDNNSLRLPDVERIRRYLLSYKDFNSVKHWTDDWIPYDLLELAALAQHYGLETRLLDWTSSIDTAIYFSVCKDPVLSDEEKESPDSKYVAIWMLNTGVEHKSDSLRFIRPPYFGNPNLAAQKGLFSYWKEPGFKVSSNTISQAEVIEHYKIKVNRTPLDERLKEELSGKSLHETYMMKLMIPRTDRKALFEYINKKGVNASCLFPGYAGVVQSINEMRMIQ